MLGEIRPFAGSVAPPNWMLCEGQPLQINEYLALFSLIGTTYGGDGKTTFALPDLRGRIPVGMGDGFNIGQSGGSEQVALTVATNPQHTHSFLASVDLASTADPTNAVPASAEIYTNAQPNSALSPMAVGTAGESQPHQNMMPWLCVSYIISVSDSAPQS